MELSFETPALLFPTVSLLLLAYTNRFLALANRIRDLHRTYKERPSDAVLGQIRNLRHRILLIRGMQGSGALSLITCTVCMFLIYAGISPAAHVVFVLSLILMITSLTFSVLEIHVSTVALDILLGDLEDQGKP